MTVSERMREIACVIEINITTVRELQRVMREIMRKVCDDE